MVKGPNPIVVVGSINFDLVARTTRIPVAGETIIGDDFQMHPGGKGANQAVAAARLGCPVQMIGKLGSDEFAVRLRSQMTEAGVDLSGVGEAEGASGVAVIAVTPHGENSIIVVRGANAQVSPEYVDQHAGLIRNAALVLTQLEIPLATVERVAELCERYGVPLILDPAPAQDLPQRLLNRVRWLTPNEIEASFYAPAARSTTPPETVADLILGAGTQGVVLKLGSRGVYLAADGVAEHVPGIDVEAVDTTAAGDAFNGAFAVGLQTGRSPLESARFAVAASAISVTRPGAQPSMPRLEEVQALLKQLHFNVSHRSEREVV